MKTILGAFESACLCIIRHNCNESACIFRVFCYVEYLQKKKTIFEDVSIHAQ
jgi:hypothetical protein